MRLLLIVFILSAFSAFAQICSVEDADFIQRILDKPTRHHWDKEGLKDRIVEKVGREFLGQSYVSGTLDIYEEEQLLVNSDSLDCTTYLELVLAISRSILKREYTLGNVQKELLAMRYRDGVIKNYLSRNHYFSGFLMQQEKMGLLKNISLELGGELLVDSIQFMSKNSDKYPKINTPKAVQKIKSIEDSINAYSFGYIPQEKVASIESRIPNGSIVAFTTSIKGLDVVHVGFVVFEEDGKPHLMHASSDYKKVVVSDKVLSDYVLGNKIQNGIIVVKIL